MQMARVFVVLAASILPQSFARTRSPVAKVLELLSQMEAKISSQGKEEKRVFHEFEEWCEDEARQLGFEIKTDKDQIRESKAVIEEDTATQSALSQKISKLAEAINDADRELTEATKIREKEAADFAAESKELSEVVHLLERAMLELQQKVGDSLSMAQLKGEGSVTQALAAIVGASTFTPEDVSRIASFEAQLQEGDEEFAPPQAAAYKERTGGIMDTMKNMLEKTKAQLSKVQKEEADALHNYEMLKQSLEAEIRVGKVGNRRNALYVDGISIYKMDSTTGKIECHRVEKMLINNIPVVPPYGVLTALRDELLMPRERVPVGVGVGVGAMIEMN